ncbi:MAG: hypothetical protein V7754_19785 [Halioglobus sp.]
MNHRTGIKQLTMYLPALLCAFLLPWTQLQAEVADNSTPLSIDISQGGDDLRTTELRKYFARIGRDFEVFRVSSVTRTEAGEAYKLTRETAGNFRYNALNVSHHIFYKQIAQSVNDNFVPLEDTIHHDDSGVTGTEMLQIIYRQAKALGNEKADLDAVDGRVTVTYAYDERKLIIVPTTFNFVDGAKNTEGTELKSHLGVNGFSKHYLLSMILNDEAKVTMAGKIYIRLESLDDSPLDLAHAFNDEGEVDLKTHAFNVTVTNESGTFKPDGAGIPAFAQLLVDRLGLEEVHYHAWVPEGEWPIEGTAVPTED